MNPMPVTLDVSQLSGWLNAAAACRVEREACGKRGGMRGRATGGARVGTAAAQEMRAGRDQTVEVVLAGAGAERTANMLRIFVALDVSQLEMSALKKALHGA